MLRSCSERLGVFDEFGKLLLEDGDGIGSISCLNFLKEVSQLYVTLVEVQGLLYLKCLLHFKRTNWRYSALGIYHEHWSFSYFFQMLHRIVAETVLSWNYLILIWFLPIIVENEHLLERLFFLYYNYIGFAWGLLFQRRLFLFRVGKREIMQTFNFPLLFWLVLDNFDHFGSGLVLQGTYCNFLHIRVRRALLVWAKVELLSWKLLVGIADGTGYVLSFAEILPIFNLLYLLFVLKLLHYVENLRGSHPPLLRLLFLLLLSRLFRSNG